MYIIYIIYIYNIYIYSMYIHKSECFLFLSAIGGGSLEAAFLKLLSIEPLAKVTELLYSN